MIHTFLVVGEIKKINISESKDQKKTASAVLLVQYNAQREPGDGAMEFSNTVMIRVPPEKFRQLRGQLALGKKVQVTGHLQGLCKSVYGESYFTTELVADRIWIDDANGQAPAPLEVFR